MLAWIILKTRVVPNSAHQFHGLAATEIPWAWRKVMDNLEWEIKTNSNVLGLTSHSCKHVENLTLQVSSTTRGTGWTEVVDGPLRADVIRNQTPSPVSSLSSNRSANFASKIWEHATKTKQLGLRGCKGKNTSQNLSNKPQLFYWGNHDVTELSILYVKAWNLQLLRVLKRSPSSSYLFCFRRSCGNLFLIQELMACRGILSLSSFLWEWIQ